MIAIWSLTVGRLREPAFVMILLIGAVIAYLFAPVNTFELPGIGLSVDAAAVDAADNLGKSVLMGTVLLTILSMLITIFVAASEIPRDIGSRFISIFLAKPLSRLEYLVGKFIGSLTIGLVFGVLWLTVMLIVRYGLQTPAETLSVAILVNQYACLLMLLPACALSICISCFFGDVVAMIITCVYALLAFGFGIIPVIVNILDLKVLLVVYYLVPNLTYFLRVHESPFLLFMAVVYACSSSAIFILLGRMKFESGDVY